MIPSERIAELRRIPLDRFSDVIVEWVEMLDEIERLKGDFEEFQEWSHCDLVEEVIALRAMNAKLRIDLENTQYEIDELLG